MPLFAFQCYMSLQGEADLPTYDSKLIKNGLILCSLANAVKLYHQDVLIGLNVFDAPHLSVKN